MHQVLTTSAVSVAGTSPSRSFAMLTTSGDPTTVVAILAGNEVGASGVTSGVVIKTLTPTTPYVQVTDSSTYLYYAVTQGTPPSVVWLDTAP